MSALGQKRTLVQRVAMSASSPLKWRERSRRHHTADNCSAGRNDDDRAFYETWEEDKINPVTGQRETFIHREYYPPDTKAANQWLTNRKRHEWKNVQNTEV